MGKDKSKKRSRGKIATDGQGRTKSSFVNRQESAGPSHVTGGIVTASNLPGGPKEDKLTRDKTSVVWNYFDKVTVDGKNKRRCKVCLAKKKKRDLTGDTSGTTNMWNHLLQMHSDLYYDIFPEKKLVTGQRRMEDFTGGKQRPFDKHEFWMTVAKWVVADDVPFKQVESKACQAAFYYCNRKAKLPSRRSLMRKIEILEQELTPQIKAMLEAAPGLISVTHDDWTAPNRRAFKAVTVHFVDSEWRLQSFLLGFEQIEGEHDAEQLYQVFMGVVSDPTWGLNMDKILGITSDNATVNTCFIDLLVERQGYNKKN